MGYFGISSGVNMRLPGYETPKGMALLMQNYDRTHDEIVEQIKGSSKYHGGNIGTSAPTAIMVNYNENEDKQDVLAAVDSSILKKDFGANEFESLKSGFTPNRIRTGLNLESKLFIPHPVDGLFEFDGIQTVAKVNAILLKDLVIDKGTNRCFGITADDELAWTDDLADTGGVPLVWPGANIATLPPTQGDVMEKLILFNGRLVVLKTNSVWVDYAIGSPSNWRLEKLAFSGGCIAPWTVKIVNGEIWFLGFSPETGRGLYSLDGSYKVKLISYDVEPILNRINYHKIKEACAEFVDNIYKLSFALDSDAENNHCFHFDSLNYNKETGVPNIYGLHTYGFSASAVLNTRKFRGEHLFSRKHSDGARIFKVGDYRTQYSDEMSDNGSLIPAVLLSGIFQMEGDFDQTWYKRYKNLYVEYPPRGAWKTTIDVLKGFENETFNTYDQYLEGGSIPVDALDLGSDSLDYESLSDELHAMDFVSDSIQFRISNYNVNTKSAFRSIRYDAAPHRRKKSVQTIEV